LEAISTYGKDTFLIDGKCKYGWTPLHSAVHHGNMEAVSFLVQNGANIEAVNNLGELM
jgi:ankyrin repeat protein